MPNIILSRNSKIPPTPDHVIHKGVMPVMFNCHMGAVFWALMTLGNSAARAHDKVSEYAKATCPGCTGTAPCGPLSPTDYARDFCQTARRIPSRDHLYHMVEVGDVLITDRKEYPSHSMILRQRRGPTHITVRGYNNKGTLNTGIVNKYDPSSHNIVQDKYWFKPETGKFGIKGQDLFVIKSQDFLSQASALNRMTG